MTNSDICARIDGIIASLQSTRTYVLENTLAEATALTREGHDFQPAGQLLLALALAKSVESSEDLDHETAEARHRGIRQIIDRELYHLRPILDGANRTARFIGAHMIALDTITSCYEWSSVVIGASVCRSWSFREDLSRREYLIAEVAALETARSGGNISTLKDLEKRKSALRSDLIKAVNSLVNPNWREWLQYGTGQAINNQIYELGKNGAVLKVPIPELDYAR